MRKIIDIFLRSMSIGSGWKNTRDEVDGVVRKTKGLDVALKKLGATFGKYNQPGDRPPAPFATDVAHGFRTAKAVRPEQIRVLSKPMVTDLPCDSALARSAYFATSIVTIPATAQYGPKSQNLSLLSDLKSSASAKYPTTAATAAP